MTTPPPPQPVTRVEFLRRMPTGGTAHESGQGAADPNAAGYIIAGPGTNDPVEADWDGKVYQDLDEAKAELAKCRQTYTDWDVYALRPQGAADDDTTQLRAKVQELRAKFAERNDSIRNAIRELLRGGTTDRDRCISALKALAGDQDVNEAARAALSAPAPSHPTNTEETDHA